MKILNEKELDYVVGGGENLNAFCNGVDNGWERGIRGVKDGVSSIYKGIKENSPTDISEGAGDLTGVSAFIVAVGVFARSAAKVAMWLDKKISK